MLMMKLSQVLLMMIFMTVDDVEGSNHDYESDDNVDESGHRSRILDLDLLV